MSLPVSVSASDLFTNYAQEDEVFAALSEAGYQYIDFWVYMYGETVHRPMLTPNWRYWAQSVKETAEKYGIIIGQCHAPMPAMDIPEDFSYTGPDELMLNSIEACHLVGCSKMVFHPHVYKQEQSDPVIRKRIIDYNVRWFSDILPVAKRFSVQIQIENLFDYPKVDGRQLVFTDAEDIMDLLDALNDETFKVCLDTGHASLEGKDIPSMIHLYGDRLQTLHLNDNYGSITPVFSDLHLFPGYGNLDWPSILSALKEIGYSGTLNMEPIAGLNHVSRSAQVSMLRAGREIMKIMADEVNL